MSNQVAKPLRILVVRNDKIGDFMLAWPSFALLKKSLPEAEITALVPAYTQELASACPYVDKVILDPQDLSQINYKNFDASLCLFSTPRIAWQAFKGRIPLRVAPATQWQQILFNKTLKQRRSQSIKPEFEYNLDLTRFFIEQLSNSAGRGVELEVTPPYWPLTLEEKSEQREFIYQELNLSNLEIAQEDKLYFVHSGSGGSANNLSLEQYAELIICLDKNNNDAGGGVAWIITAGPDEVEQAQSLIDLLPKNIKVVLYESKKGLLSFAKSISAADLFIAGSTGPLHISGALNVPTIGFYPAKRSANPLRWQPCNDPAKHQAFAPQEGSVDMSNININIICKE